MSVMPGTVDVDALNQKVIALEKIVSELQRRVKELEKRVGAHGVKDG